MQPKLGWKKIVIQVDTHNNTNTEYSSWMCAKGRIGIYYDFHIKIFIMYDYIFMNKFLKFKLTFTAVSNWFELFAYLFYLLTLPL